MKRMHNRNGIRILTAGKPIDKTTESMEVVQARCIAHKKIVHHGTIWKPKEYEAEYQEALAKVKATYTPGKLNIFIDESIRLVVGMQKSFILDANYIRVSDVNLSGCCDEVLFPAIRDAGYSLLTKDEKSSHVYQNTTLYDGLRAIILPLEARVGAVLENHVSAIRDYCMADDSARYWLIVDGEHQLRQIHPKKIKIPFFTSLAPEGT